MAAVTPTDPYVTIGSRAMRTASSGTARDFGSVQNLEIQSYRFDNVNGTTPDTWASGIRDVAAVFWEADAEADLCIPTFAQATGTVTFTHSVNADCDGILHVVRKSR